MAQLLTNEGERVAPSKRYRTIRIQEGKEMIEFDCGDLEYAISYVERFPLCSYRIYNDHGEVVHETRSKQ